MLVLSRKLGERIVIPGLAAEIAVVAIQGKKVRLAISAPVEVSVERMEVWHRHDHQKVEPDLPVG